MCEPGGSLTRNNNPSCAQQVFLNVSQLETNSSMIVERLSESKYKFVFAQLNSSAVAFKIPKHAYHDVAGNFGANDTDILIPSQKTPAPAEVTPPPNTTNLTAVPFSLAEGVKVATPVIVGSSASISGLTVLGSSIAGASLTKDLIGGSNLLRADYHVQILTMCVNLAIPSDPDMYWSIVQHLSWSTLNIRKDSSSKPEPGSLEEPCCKMKTAHLTSLATCSKSS